MSRRETEEDKERRSHAETWPAPPQSSSSSSPAYISNLHAVISSTCLNEINGPHSPASPLHTLPSLSKTSNEENSVETSTHHTGDTAVIVTLPHIRQGSGEDVIKKKIKSRDSDKFFEPLLETRLKPQKREIPSYNVRTVVRRENHPLWSHSIQVQFQYLFGNNISYMHSPACDKRKINKKLLELPKDQKRKTFEAAECTESTIEENCERAIKDSHDMELTMPKKIAVRSLQSHVDTKRETSPEEKENQQTKKKKYSYLGPREFATLIPLLLRDECVARQFIVEEERYEALHTLPLPPYVSQETLHPALVDGCREIILTEDILRRELLAEESMSIAPLWDLFVYEHRWLVVGTAPLKKFLRNWLNVHRGRKRRQLARFERLTTQEITSRNEISMEWWEAQRELFATLTAIMERRYRTNIERLQLCTQYAQGVVSIRMQEYVERFPLLYGAVMSRTYVCGRISGLTLFKQLDLLQEHNRCQLTKIEEGEYIGISRTMLRVELERFTEVDERLQIVREEEIAHMQLRFRLLAARERCHRRELEIVEACEREIDLKSSMQAILALISEEGKYDQEEYY
ncbi:hypothetical protein LSM04_005951 [Trypanosoma melophagium]|uniref:uncharacterized protein n=1 Tax=Trypanosoma melophagium TaxID=715481 RepID=UPI00351A31B6|nr:hypothetical protein LSM04_005951 [Trypanosoma melophagium]